MANYDSNYGQNNGARGGQSYENHKKTKQKGSRELQSDSRPIVEMIKVDLKNLDTHNYVDTADEVMQSILNYETTTKQKNKLTTTKLRSLLTLVNRAEDLARLDSGTELQEERIQDLLHAQIRFVYESGREEGVKRFLDQTQLLQFLKRVIQSRKKTDFDFFARYFESLVAYHRFHGGKDR